MAKFARSKTVGFVLSEGRDVAVWDAEIDGPRWRKSLNSEVLAVGASEGLVICLEANGVLSFWNATSAAIVSHVMVPGAYGLTCSQGAACAVSTADHIEYLDAQGRRSLPYGQVRAMAFSRDGRKLGFGLSEGQFGTVDLASGQSTQNKVGSEAVLSVVERAPGAEWLAAAGSSVYAVTAEGQVSRVTGKEGSVIAELCVNERGTLFGMQADTLAVALAWPSKATAGHLSYGDREITGLALGDAALWVGLDQCDGNKLDLRTGDLYRTDPHPGVERARWLVGMGHEADVALAHV
jgi:hypothetical protein